MCSSAVKRRRRLTLAAFETVAVTLDEAVTAPAATYMTAGCLKQTDARLTTD